MDERCLPPWRAFVGLLICGFFGLALYRGHVWDGACGFFFVAGMYMQDWGNRLRDKWRPVSASAEQT
jgi:hypothetical protein